MMKTTTPLEPLTLLLGRIRQALNHTIRKSKPPAPLLSIAYKPSFLQRHPLIDRILDAMTHCPFDLPPLRAFYQWDDHWEEVHNREYRLVQPVHSLLEGVNHRMKDLFYLPLVIRDKDGCLTLRLGDENGPEPFCNLDCRTVSEMYFLLCGMLDSFVDPAARWEREQDEFHRGKPKYQFGDMACPDDASIDAHPVAYGMYGIYCDRYLMWSSDPHGLKGFQDFLDTPNWRVLQVDIHGDPVLMLDLSLPHFDRWSRAQTPPVVLCEGLTAPQAEQAIVAWKMRLGLDEMNPLMRYMGYCIFRTNILFRKQSFSPRNGGLIQSTPFASCNSTPMQEPPSPLQSNTPVPEHPPSLSTTNNAPVKGQEEIE